MDYKRWELRPDDEMFPQALRDNNSAKVEVLYGIGEPGCLSEASLAIIGARRATPYGVAIAEMAGRVAGESGIVVVSGGAMGCDCAASRAASGSTARTSSRRA